MDNRYITGFTKFKLYFFKSYRWLIAHKFKQLCFFISAEYTWTASPWPRRLRLASGINLQPVLDGFIMHTIGVS